MKFVKSDGFLVHLEEVLSEELCTQIIQQFNKDETKGPGKAYNLHGKLTKEAAKISIDLAVGPEGDWSDIHQQLHKAFSEAILTYAKSSPALQVAPFRWTPYKIKRYLQGHGKFDWHMDALSVSTMNRQVAILCYLNDVAEGGHTEFFHQGLKIAPKRGNLILFLTFWTHLHRGSMPLSGDKYIISTFAEFDFGESN